MLSLFTRFACSICFVCLSCFMVMAQEANPFKEMAGKRYAEYSQELFDQGLLFAKLDTVEARKVINQIKEVAESTKDVTWEVEAEYFELSLFDIKRNLYGNDRYPAEELLRRELILLEKARDLHLLPMELKLRHAIIGNYWLFIKNYEQAFEQCSIQAKCLETVSLEEIPEKAFYYLQIGNAYYTFRDYSKAMSYYEKILAEKLTPRNEPEHQGARNGMGLCYRYGLNNDHLSDSCFRLMTEIAYLRPENESHREVWIGIAEGNIGYNMFLRGAYNEAIPLLKSSISKVLKEGDYAYASGPAINLADIYLRKGEIAQAKYYMELAAEYEKRMPRDGRLPRIYEIMSKYYAATGNTKLSTVYMDSTLASTTQYNNQFSALQLMRAEQKAHAFEQRAREEALNSERIRSAGYRRYVVAVSSGLFLVTSLLGILWFLYRKKRAAYRELVRKSQAWAKMGADHKLFVKADPEDQEQTTAPDQADALIMQQLETLMLETQIYKEAALSLEMLAQKLGVKRYLVSQSINRCTGKSFHTFVNEYRIKEAIRIMSGDDMDGKTIDTIAYDSGFNDRKAFYRIFKGQTGLSPTAFRKNISE